MKICVYVLANNSTGLGHLYRCLALRDDTRSLGHDILLASDAGFYNPKLRQIIDIPVRGMPSAESMHKILNTHCDWLLFDLKWPIPKGYRQIANQSGVLVGTLNGIGYDSLSAVDLSWPQNSPDRIILRKAIRDAKWTPIKGQWLCFGGSVDVMGLLNKYHGVGPRPCYMITTKLNDEVFPKKSGYQIINDPGEEMVWYLQHTERACIASGMLSWELSYFGVPQYLFSQTPGHLVFSHQMVNAGLAMMWPTEGVPSSEKLLEFLDHSFVPRKTRLDGRGGERLIRQMEMFDDVRRDRVNHNYGDRINVNAKKEEDGRLG